MKFHAIRLALVLATATGPALAHHSFAMFDPSRTVALFGEVESFEMINPHGWLKVVVRDGDKTRTWSLETGPPQSMRNAGWTAQSVLPGDRVSVKLHPMKDGSYGGQLVSVKLADGSTLPGGPGYARGFHE